MLNESWLGLPGSFYKYRMNPRGKCLKKEQAERSLSISQSIMRPWQSVTRVKAVLPCQYLQTANAARLQGIINFSRAGGGRTSGSVWRRGLRSLGGTVPAAQLIIVLIS